MRRRFDQYMTVKDGMPVRHTFSLLPPHNNNWLPDDIIDWCCEMFGGADLNRWDFCVDTVYFSNENDAFAFKMRWG